jgi:hypothetical protein
VTPAEPSYSDPLNLWRKVALRWTDAETGELWGVVAALFNGAYPSQYRVMLDIARGRMMRVVREWESGLDVKPIGFPCDEYRPGVYAAELGRPAR